MRLALLALSAVLAAPAGAQVTWQVSGDTAAAVGAEARVIFKAATPPGARLVPDALASATTDFAVLKAEALPDGSWAWTVLPLNEGALEFVPAWNLDGKPLKGPGAPLAVFTPAIAKDADIADIKPPVAARRALWPWLLAALLGALAWEAWRRWKARPAAAAPSAPPEPPLAPELAAERDLAALEASGLWARGEHSAYYLRLTEILREYLERRYGEPATAMTSVEVARLVKAKQPDLKSAALVRELLSRADLVKFARITPGADDGARDAASVREVVRATTPAPAPAEAAS